MELTLGDERYLCRTELVDKAYEAFRALGIRPPLQIARIENKSNPVKIKADPEYCSPTLFPDEDGV